MEHIISSLIQQLESSEKTQTPKAAPKGKGKDVAAPPPDEISNEEENLVSLCEVIYNTNFVIEEPILLDLLVKLLDQFEQTSNDNVKNSILNAIRVAAQSSSFRERIFENGITQAKPISIEYNN